MTVTNTSLVPVEVYSLDFDEAWLQEEEILRVQEGYVRNEVFMPPRDVGAPLPEEMVQYYEAVMAEKAAREAPPPEEDAAEEEAAPEEVPVDAEDDAESVPPPPARMVVVMGPPLSGQTAIVEECKHQLGFTQFSLEDAVDVLIKDAESEAGEALRAHLEYQTAAMIKAAKEEAERPPSRGSNKSGRSKSSAKSSSKTKSRPPSAAASAKSGAEASVAESAGGVSVEAEELVDPPVPVKPLTAELVSQVVAEYVKRLLPTMDPRSFVIDTLHSPYLPNAMNEETGE
jgi:hypothetical protein